MGDRKAGRSKAEFLKEDEEKAKKIVLFVSNKFEISYESIFDKTITDRHVKMAKHWSMFLIKFELEDAVDWLSLSLFFNLEDHTTSMYGYKKILKMTKESPLSAQRFDIWSKEINQLLHENKTNPTQ